MSDITSMLGSPPVSNPLGQSTPLSGAAGGTMGKDQFLKLLIAQMQNQDPLNPMDGMQFASQLAQFSSVEQLQQLNTKLEGEAAAQNSMLAALNGSVAVSTFGREVMAVGSQMNIGGAEPAQAVFDAPPEGGRAKVQIYDAAGSKVGTVDLGKIRGGFQSAALGDSVRDLPAGTYQYQVEMTDETGAVTTAQTYIKGRVDGIHYTSDGPVLTSGGMSIPFGSVLKILTAD